jgi:hypothetical protein
VDLRQSDEAARRWRRQQRRRAAIGWLVGGGVFALVVLAAILGGSSDEGESPHPGPFGYAMTAQQYAELSPGLEENAFVNRLEQTGLPEGLTKDQYVHLFPAHSEAVNCSFWEISDRVETVARICFAQNGKLVEKLLRAVGEKEAGVSV